jgi:aspartokinase
MTFAALLEEFGPLAITLVDELIATIEKKGTVTTEEWDAIRAKGNDTSVDRMKAVLAQQGIDPESDQGKALLAAAAHPGQ